MKKYLIIGLLLLLILSLIFRIPKRVHPPIQKPTQVKQDLQDYFKSRGEAGLAHKMAQPLVAVYEKMLSQYPDNMEIKKKLALAYCDAGNYKSALPLLEEVSKSTLGDPSVQNKLEEAKKAPSF